MLGAAADGPERRLLQVLSVETADRSAVALDVAGRALPDFLDRLWAGKLKATASIRLVLGAGAGLARSPSCVPMPSICARRHRVQPGYMEATLAAHPSFARGFADLFVARLDPALGEARSPP